MTKNIKKQKPLSNWSKNRSDEIITHTHTHKLPTLNENHLHVRMVLPGLGGGATVLRIVSLTGSQVLVIGLFSHAETHSYTSMRAHTHTLTHTNTKCTEIPLKSKLCPTW